MNLSAQAIKDFKEAYKADHGITLNDAEARRMASELLGFYKLISKHHAKNTP